MRRSSAGPRCAASHTNQVSLAIVDFALERSAFFGGPGVASAGASLFCSHWSPSSVQRGLRCLPAIAENDGYLEGSRGCRYLSFFAICRDCDRDNRIFSASATYVRCGCAPFIVPLAGLFFVPNR